YLTSKHRAAFCTALDKTQLEKLTSVDNCCCLTATRSVAGRGPSRRTRPSRPASENAPANTRTRAPSPLPASRRCIHCAERPCLESLPLYLLYLACFLHGSGPQLRFRRRKRIRLCNNNRRIQAH